MTSRGCRDKDSKKIQIYLEHVQRMSRGCPEDVLRMSKGHPEGSKGSPEEGLGMYNNAYISMSRNHNDSDLRHCCVDG
mgnify:CR=1 FL=1